MATTMTALVWRPDAGLAVDSKVAVPTPKMSPEEALVRVRFCGVCGTDLHILEKAFGFDPITIMGHEVVGVDVATGQRVFVNPLNECGACAGCQSGKPNFCRNAWTGDAIGVGRDGGWAEFVATSKNTLLPLPDDLPLEVAVLVEPLTCVERGLTRLGRLLPHHRFMVLGAGITGMLFLTTLHHSGVRNLTLVELSQGRREKARNIGFPITVLDPAELKASDTKFDVIIDCTGSPKAMESSIGNLERAGTYLIFGCAPAGQFAKIDLSDIVYNQWKILGSRMNPYTTIDAIAKLRDMYHDGLINPDRLGIKYFPLHDHKKALDALQKGDISKAVFTLPEGQ